MCDPLSVGSVTRKVAVTVGPPQVLVNVAGIGVAATVLETSDEDWNRVLAVNLTGPFLTIRATLPLMLDRGSGVVVNIASVAGQVGLARRAAYCASKAGLVGLTRAVAVDHAGEGIRCVALCPGTVETEWIAKIIADAPDPAAVRQTMARAAARRADGIAGRGRRHGRLRRQPGWPVHQRSRPRPRRRDDRRVSAPGGRPSARQHRRPAAACRRGCRLAGS